MTGEKKYIWFLLTTIDIEWRFYFKSVRTHKTFLVWRCLKCGKSNTAVTFIKTITKIEHGYSFKKNLLYLRILTRFTQHLAIKMFSTGRVQLINRTYYYFIDFKPNYSSRVPRLVLVVTLIKLGSSLLLHFHRYLLFSLWCSLLLHNMQLYVFHIYIICYNGIDTTLFCSKLSIVYM